MSQEILAMNMVNVHNNKTLESLRTPIVTIKSKDAMKDRETNLVSFDIHDNPAKTGGLRSIGTSPLWT